MGRHLFHLPDVGEGVTEAEVVAWHVMPGDVVEDDQSLVDVMTDKATVELTSPVPGVVIAVHGEIGARLPVGTVLVEFEVEGEDDARAIDADVPGSPAPSTFQPPLPAQPIAANNPVPDHVSSRTSVSPVAAPATRRRAYELGIPLQFVPGTGPGGRITPDDLECYIANGCMQIAGTGTAEALRSGIEETRIVGVRRKIAERMVEAKRNIPHITYVEECDLTELEALRNDLNAHRDTEQPKLTLLPFLIRALVQALPDFPQINARFDDDAGLLQRFAPVHVGIATQTPSGLMVPVIHHAETFDVWSCAGEIARLSTTARDGSIAHEKLTGSTITITSLGLLGGIATTPIINRPEVAIIAPNKLVDRPVVHGSLVTVRKMLNLSSSFDHRIIDGYDAALFIQRLKRLLEHPALIFMP